MITTCDQCGQPIVELGIGLYHEDGTEACTDAFGMQRATRSAAQVPSCDFCGAEGHWPSFIKAQPVQASILEADADGRNANSLTLDYGDEWAICGSCRLNAALRQFGAIVDRAMATIIGGLPNDSDPELTAEVRGQITELHEAVWAGWDGKFHPFERDSAKKS